MKRRARLFDFTDLLPRHIEAVDQGRAFYADKKQRTLGDITPWKGELTPERVCTEPAEMIQIGFRRRDYSNSKRTATQAIYKANSLCPLPTMLS
jgi:hypothetical protein